MGKEWIKINSEELGIKPDVYVRILRTTLEPGVKDLSELDKIIETGDLKQIGTITHRLKGTFSNLRIKDVAAPCEAIHTLSKTIGNRERMRQNFTQLKKAFENFKIQIE